MQKYNWWRNIEVNGESTFTTEDWASKYSNNLKNKASYILIVKFSLKLFTSGWLNITILMIIANILKFYFFLPTLLHPFCHSRTITHPHCYHYREWHHFLICLNKFDCKLRSLAFLKSNLKYILFLWIFLIAYLSLEEQ